MGRRIAIGALVGLVVLVLLRIFVFRLYVVPSPSMAPTILAGDWLVVDRTSVGIKVGDIVVFDHHDQAYVKRVIGASGDTVEEKDGQFRVNEKPLVQSPAGETGLDDDGVPVSSTGPSSYALFHERTGDRVWDVARFRGAPPESHAWTVPADSLFVVGDNRDNSVDSRADDFGFVPLKSIAGRVNTIVWSTDKSGFRSGRWMKPVDE